MYFSLAELHHSYGALRRLAQANLRAQRVGPAIAGLNKSPGKLVMARDRPRSRPAGEQIRTDHPTAKHLRGARR